MRLKEIPLQDVFAGKNWRIRYASREDVPNPPVDEAIDFHAGDTALFSAVAKLADGSEHPTLAVKIFDEGGHHQIHTFIYTRHGWVDAMSEGFYRALGKYAHDIFPFEVFIGNPWDGDLEVKANADQHRKVFSDSLPKMRVIKYETRTTTRRWPLDEPKPGGPGSLAPPTGPASG